jgi:hypothetical protein
MAALYRVRQFALALAAGWRPAALSERAAAALLSPAQLALFRRMTPAERQHSLRVLARLQAAGQRDPALLAAALLHDVGKTRVRLHLWERALPVLLRVLAPGLAARWAAGPPRGWRRAFVVAHRHPAWGAKLAAAADSPAVTVQLIRYHQTRAGAELPAEAAPLAPQLAALQAADDAS